MGSSLQNNFLKNRIVRIVTAGSGLRFFCLL
nr:MAG TPA: hypothetical protein [Caudoviricetes sp.]